MVTEYLLWLASLVGLPHWLLGTVDMLNNSLVSKIIDYFVGLAVEAFFSRLWRVVRPLFSRGWEIQSVVQGPERVGLDEHDDERALDELRGPDELRRADDRGLLGYVRGASC